MSSKTEAPAPATPPATPPDAQTSPPPPPSSHPTPAPRRPWSLVARMTIWYTLSTCALSALVAVSLYRGLRDSIDDQADKFLTDKTRVLQSFIERPAARFEDLRQEVEEEWATRQLSQVYSRVIDGTGRVVTESPGMSKLLPVSLFPPPQPPVPDDDTLDGVEIKGSSGGPYRAVTGRAHWAKRTDSASDYVVQVAIDTHVQREVAVAYVRRLSLALAALVALAGLVGVVLARRGLRPLAQVARTIRGTRTTSLHERLDASQLPAEIRSLADSFNRLLDRLQDAFARLAEFSGDIAHELRTPIHAMLSAIDVTLSRPRTPDEYRDALGSCAEECYRLSRLIDNLLFLARAEDPRGRIDREEVDVRHELEVIRDFYEAPADEAGVQLTVSAPDGLAASADRILLQRAIGNLVTNAIRYTPRGGQISLTARADHDDLIIEAVDTGCGIPAEQLPRIFDRLYRVDPSRTSSTGAVGLGLSIVKKIATLHGGTVAATSQPGAGTTIRLTLPLRPPLQ